MCADERLERRSTDVCCCGLCDGFGCLCWSGFEGGLFGGCLGFGRGVGCLCDYMVLPLLNWEGSGGC